MADGPLLRRFPALAQLPRASFGAFPTPVTRIALDDARTLLVKRDDRSGISIGGNKVRALEWLLGGVRAGDHVLTVGPRGSTHALATATYAVQLGARCTVVRWPQEMNLAARRIDERLRGAARVLDAPNVIAAYAVSAWESVRQRVRWIPAGGTSPLGILGHVNGALELAEQIERGESPMPAEVIVPLGTGGTVAGIALGLHIAGLRVRLRAVRVAPRIIASRGRIGRLIQRTRHLMETITQAPVPWPRLEDLRIDGDFYGAGYGHAIAPSPREAALADAGIRLDDTYARKAFAAAATTSASDRSLFWLTFDGRLLQD